jgi:hypothetical protein
LWNPECYSRSLGLAKLSYTRPVCFWLISCCVWIVIRARKTAIDVVVLRPRVGTALRAISHARTRAARIVLRDGSRTHVHDGHHARQTETASACSTRQAGSRIRSMRSKPLSGHRSAFGTPHSPQCAEGSWVQYRMQPCSTYVLYVNCGSSCCARGLSSNPTCMAACMLDLVFLSFFWVAGGYWMGECVEFWRSQRTILF